MSCFCIKVHIFTKFESVSHNNTCTYPQNVSTCSNRRTGANMRGNTVSNTAFGDTAKVCLVDFVVGNAGYMLFLFNICI